MEWIPKGWVEITPADLSVLLMVGVITFAIKRAAHLSDDWGLLLAMGSGMLYGIVQAYDTGFAAAAHIFKGVALNGGGAYLIAQTAHRLLPQRALGALQTGNTEAPFAHPNPPPSAAIIAANAADAAAEAEKKGDK